tara:strand:+ start:560 stop:1549 length:990 start_codon:yes stop_codon:yes gene_type:complete
MKSKICVVYTHHKLGDLIWQLPYIKAISEHHAEKVDLIVREKTQAKNILRYIKHINKINYNNFRKGIYYWLDVIKLIKIFLEESYSYVYILDKVNKPAIAAKFAGIKNIIGPGIRRQKKWLSGNNFLSDDDWNLNYSEQSQKLLKINNINITNIYPDLEFDLKKIDIKDSNFVPEGKKIAFGVDSFEDYKIWYEEYFVELANKLYEKKIFDYVYLVCGKEKSNISEKIISLSKKKYFIDCSDKDLINIIIALKNCDFFVGNNSGPLNLAAALGIKSFGLFSNSPISELKYSKIIPITSLNYKDNVFDKKRETMKNLTVDQVYSKIISTI